MMAPVESPTYSYWDVMRKIVLAALWMLAMGGANAQVYVGGALGVAKTSVDCTGASSCDSTNTGYKAYLGYTDVANSIMSVEVGYLDFGKAKASGPGVTVSIKDSAYYLAGVLHGNFTPSFGGDGHLGMAYVKTTCAVSVAGVSGLLSETNMKPYFGVSLDYAFTPKFKAIGSLDFTKGECASQSGGLMLLSVGAKYAF